MTIPCPDCGRSFGGTFAYSRHIARREGRRCRKVAELRERGLIRDRAGVWRQRYRYDPQPRLPGIVPRSSTGGSRTIETRRSVLQGTDTLVRPDSATPTTNKGQM